MKEIKNQSLEYPSRSLAVANFLSSFGGGMILGKAMGLLNNVSYLKGDSLLAYLLGTTFGIMLMKMSGKNKLLQHFKKFSAISAICSVILLGLLIKFYNEIVNGGVMAFLFFAVLVFRFGFWFLGRIVRVDIAAGVGKNLAQTEFGYYLGAIVGLLAWPLWKNATIIGLLYVDIVALIVVAFLDRYSFQKLKAQFSNSSVNESLSKIPNSVFIGFAGFVVSLTVATQIVEFGFVSFSGVFFEKGNEFGSNIVAAGYIGAAIGAWFLGRTTVEYTTNQNLFGLGVILFPNFSISLFSACVLSFISLCIAFVIPFYHFPLSKELSLTMFAISSLIYDLIVLVVLDKLGVIAKKVGDVGTIANIYAYMGAVGTICMLVFVQTLHDKFSFICASFCFFLVGYLMFLRARKHTVSA